jgi:uncharacterized ferredoxin-like protein
MNIDAKTQETEAVLAAARFMCAAARTAPKGRGVDELVSLTLTGSDKDKLADEMQKIGEARNIVFFVRDAKNMRAAAAVVLFGTKNNTRGIPNCGFCGFKDCTECKEKGGRCAYCVGDLGIAIGSAAAVAADHRIDTRVMFSAGKAALELGLLGAEVKLAFGLPLSVSGKSPFFDRQ